MCKNALLILGILIVATFLLPSAKADPWNRTCIGNIETDMLCNGVCVSTNITWINFKDCGGFGCNNQTNTCNSNYNVPYEFILLTIMSFLAIAGLFFYFGHKFVDDWGVMPLFFYIMGLAFILLSVGVVSSVFSVDQNKLSTVVGTSYLLAGFIFIIFMAYVVMRFSVNFTIKFIKDVNKRGRR